MPKIINVDKNRILDVARELIAKNDLEHLNCRGIADKCGIGVGTLYHFFKSKNLIFAEIILEDWKLCIKDMNIDTDVFTGVENIYNSLKEFSKKYYSFWKHIQETSTEYVAYLNRHDELVNIVENCVEKLYVYNNKNIDKDVVHFISETILTYSTKTIEYEKIKKIINKILED